MFFALSSWTLAALLVVAVVGATVLGLAAGRRLGRAREGLREPFGVLQAATLGIVGLLLAFGLSLARRGAAAARMRRARTPAPGAAASGPNRRRQRGTSRKLG